MTVHLFRNNRAGFFLALACSLAFVNEKSARSEASDSGKTGHGGIDVLLPNGSSQPIEAFLEESSVRSTEKMFEGGRAERIQSGTPNEPSVCAMMDRKDSPGDSKVWRKKVNHIVASLYQKYPIGAYTLADSFSTTQFYLLDLPKGTQLSFTGDDGVSVEYHKFNGAKRIGDDVFIVRDVWNSYWLNRKPGFEYNNMLTRVTHEALLKHYESKLKDKLGKGVIEILRLSGEFTQFDGPTTLLKKTSSQVALLWSNEFSLRQFQPKQTATEKGVMGYVWNGYFHVPVNGERQVVTQRWGTYPSAEFQRAEGEYQAFLNRISKIEGCRWPDSCALVSTFARDFGSAKLEIRFLGFDELLEIEKKIQSLGEWFYIFEEVTDERSSWPRKSVHKIKINDQIKIWKNKLANDIPRVCNE